MPSGGHEGVEGFLVLRIPARQSSAVFHDIAGGPKDPTLVLIAGSLVILTEDIELVADETLDKSLCNLFWEPGRSGLLSLTLVWPCYRYR